MYANRSDTIVLGKSIRDALSKQKKKAVVVVVSSLSNRMFTEHIDPTEDRIHSPKDDGVEQEDTRVFRRWQA